MNENELMHYGVLGMKWGVHRSRTHAKMAKKLHSMATKEKKNGNKEKANTIERISKMHNQRSEQLIKKHKDLAGEAFDRVKNQRLGKTVAQSIMFGTYGALKYNQAMAKDNGKAKSVVNGLLYGTLNNMTGGLASIIEPRIK